VTVHVFAHLAVAVNSHNKSDRKDDGFTDHGLMLG
jgi:hypothetical protein